MSNYMATKNTTLYLELTPFFHHHLLIFIDYLQMFKWQLLLLGLGFFLIPILADNHVFINKCLIYNFFGSKTQALKPPCMSYYP